MHLSDFILHLILLFSASVCHAALTPPTPSSVLDSGVARLGAGMSYLQTSRNYDVNGQKQFLPYKNSFTLLKTTGFAQFGVTDNITIFSDVQYVWDQVVGMSTMASTGQITTVSNASFGLGDGDFGARISTHAGPALLTGEASFLTPLYKRPGPHEWMTLSTESATPAGQGVTEVRFLAMAELPLAGDFSAEGQFGFTGRTDGFASGLPYGLFLRFSSPQTFFARAGMAGEIAAADDQFADNPNAPERSSNLVGGSRAFNAINPSSVNFEAEGGFYLGKHVFAAAGARMPVYGRNIAADPVFTASLGFELGEAAPKKTTHIPSNRGFYQYYRAMSVIQVNNDLKQILIDKGEADGLQKDEILDIFEPDRSEGVPGRTIARGVLTELGLSRSKVSVREFFVNKRLEEGFVVRRPVH